MQNSDLREEKAYFFYQYEFVAEEETNRRTYLWRGDLVTVRPSFFSVVYQHGGKGRVIPQRNSRQCLQQTCLQKIWNRSIVDTFWSQRFVCVAFDIHLRSYSYRENGGRGNFVERFGGEHVVYLKACEAYYLLHWQSLNPEFWTQNIHHCCYQRCQPLQIKNLESFLKWHLTLPPHHRTLPPPPPPFPPRPIRHHGCFTKKILEILVRNFRSVRTMCGKQPMFYPWYWHMIDLVPNCFCYVQGWSHVEVSLWLILIQLGPVPQKTVKSLTLRI